MHINHLGDDASADTRGSKTPTSCASRQAEAEDQGTDKELSLPSLSPEPKPVKKDAMDSTNPGRLSCDAKGALSTFSSWGSNQLTPACKLVHHLVIPFIVLEIWFFASFLYLGHKIFSNDGHLDPDSLIHPLVLILVSLLPILHPRLLDPSPPT